MVQKIQDGELGTFAFNVCVVPANCILKLPVEYWCQQTVLLSETTAKACPWFSHHINYPKSIERKQIVNNQWQYRPMGWERGVIGLLWVRAYPFLSWRSPAEWRTLAQIKREWILEKLQICSNGYRRKYVLIKSQRSIFNPAIRLVYIMPLSPG